MSEKPLWALAERLLPRRGVERYTQALMDLGATVCTRRAPRCQECPVAAGCIARKQDRTAELPAPRARKPLPEKRATWYILWHAGRVLLERRPGSGLWGGLWTFPETPLCPMANARKLSPLEHGFTHFRLRIQPVLCIPRRLPSRTEDPHRRWMDLTAAAEAAVPAPVRKLLLKLAAGRRFLDGR